MVANGRSNRRDRIREKESTAQGDSSEDDDDDGDDGDEEQGPPLLFVLAGDDTGSGIDYNVLDAESWQGLEEYCKKWGVKQAHLESIYSRFIRTIVRTEHLDFTLKPQFHASLDFLADEFMTTAGDFAAQFFIQTWFLRRKRGLKPPKDRRCVDFARLVIMCCDLARLGDYELLVNFWACVLHRFSSILPTNSINLDTKLNTELVNEVITILHIDMDKKLNLLLHMLLSESEQSGLHQDAGVDSTGSTAISTTSSISRIGAEKTQSRGQEGTKSTDSSSVGGSKGVASAGPKDDDEEGETGGARKMGRRYLTLRSILRFSLQHPPLMFPVVQFQRVLRSKIIGSKYWLRRRKPASARGVSIRSSLALSNAYRDMFDRIEGRGQAWVVASGHLLLHALIPPTTTVTAHAAAASDSFYGGGSTGSRRGEKKQGGNADSDGDRVDEDSRGEQYSEQCRQLLDNCLRPQWYKAAGDKPTSSTVIGEVAEKMPYALKLALTRLGTGAKSATASVSSPTAKLSKAGVGANNRGTGENNSTAARAGSDQPDDSGTVVVAKLDLRTQQNSRATSPSSSAGQRSSDRSRKECTRGNGLAATAPPPSTGPAPGALDTKTCAICLRRTSPVAMCRKCGRRASKALKDARGSRQARVILVPYGGYFGVGEPDALRGEGDSVKRWVRLYDDDSGADFYYNVYYDSSVWKSGVELPKSAPVARIGRRREKGGGRGGGGFGGGTIVVKSPHSTPSCAPGENSPSPGRPTAISSSTAGAIDPASGSLAASPCPQGGAKSHPRSLTSRMTGLAAAATVAAASGSSTGLAALKKTKTALSAASMAALQAAGGTVRSGMMANNTLGNDLSAAAPAAPTTIKPAIKTPPSLISPPPSPKTTGAVASRTAGASPGHGHRVVVLSAGETAHEVILDAHKRIYPPFRLVSRVDAEPAGAMATGRAGDMGGVTAGVGFGFARTRSP